MTIGEVSKKCNISTDTLRYYEKIGGKILSNVKEEMETFFFYYACKNK